MAFDLTSLLGNAIKKINDPSKNGTILLVLNALGMVFAAASNTASVVMDKDTSKEDKKFLVPAGVVTGVANIAIYYGMTKKLIDKLGGKKIFAKNNQNINDILKKYKDGAAEIITNDKGEKFIEVKGVAHKVIEHMEKNGTFETQLSNYVNNKIAKAQKGGIFGFGKQAPQLVADMKTSLLQEVKEGVFKPSDYARAEFKDNIKSGMGVGGAFIGAVIGCAIFTPIIRDVSAYVIQRMREKKNPELQNKPYRPYFDPSHLKVDYNGKKQPLSMKTYMAFTNNGNMKI